MREDVSFYETSAQVIPLLLLAAGLETSFLKNLRPFAGEEERRKHAWTDAIYLSLGVALIMAGEVAALRASLVGHAGWLAERLTGIALLVGFWGVFTPLLNEVMATTTSMLDEHDIVGARRRAATAAGKYTSKAIHGAIWVLAGLLLAGVWV
jgi:hypothetical protein